MQQIEKVLLFPFLPFRWQCRRYLESIQDYYCWSSRKGGRLKKRFQEGEVDLRHNMEGHWWT